MVEAAVRGVRGASPHHFLGATSGIMFGVCVLPETFSFRFHWFRIVRFAWF